MVTLGPGGNLIGTDITGTMNIGNDYGVLLAGAGNLIGTNGDGVNDAAERNIISGNSVAGIWMLSSSANNDVIAGNDIGTDITGTSPLANGDGIKINGGSTEI